ncbi:hypothetical protein MRX96_000596 [Rhipicephalus microplus]
MTPGLCTAIPFGHVLAAARLRLPEIRLLLTKVSYWPPRSVGALERTWISEATALSANLSLRRQDSPEELLRLTKRL